MSREISTVISVGPDLYRRRKPIGAGVLIGFLAADSAHLHLLHHLIGKDSGAVAALLFLIAVTWGIYRICQKVRVRG